MTMPRDEGRGGRDRWWARLAVGLALSGAPAGCGHKAAPCPEAPATALGSSPRSGTGNRAKLGGDAPSPAGAETPFCVPEPRPRAPAAPGSPPAAKPAASPPELRIAVRPVALPSPTIHVAIELRAAAPADAQGWSLGHRAEASPSALAVEDDAGLVPHSFGCAAGRCKLTLSRAAQGAVRVRYDVAASAEQRGEMLGIVVATDHFYAAAEQLLLLPDALDERPVRALVRIEPEAIAAPVTASSLGVGRCQDEVVVGRLVRQLSLLGGPLGSSLLDGYEGHDEAAWSGYTAFDMRSFAAEIAETRSAMGQFFGDRGSTPATLLVVAHRRPRENVSVAQRAGGLVGFLAVDERWAGPLRLAFAQQLLHHWIGGRLWIGPTDVAREAEGAWFTDGFARHYARELLASYRLLSSTEVRDEVNALAAVQATSALSELSNAALAARSGEPAARALLVARGALFAARANALVRKRSSGKRGLDDIVRALYRQALAQGKALPHAAWRDALAVELGAAEADALDRLLLEGGAVELPPDALGPCLRPAKQRHALFGLGFDLAQTRRSTPPTLAALDPRGPAARAGARAEDLLEEIHYEDKRVDLPVRLVVRRAGQPQTLEYAPIVATVPFMGWERIPKVPEESCVQ